MSIVRLEAVRREIGDFVILDSITATIARGERVGLVGANGAGKTTLLEILTGREVPDSGAVHVSRNTRVALLTQEANLDREFRQQPSVHAVVRSGAAELEAMEVRLAQLEGQGEVGVSGAEYARVQERFEALDGYHLDHRVEEALAGLGILRSHWERDPGALSGGEQTRVALARLLIADPDLLMLDEPTNHLDIGALEWLEMALIRRGGALLVASHDRAFLDHVVGRVWELRARRLTSFRGAYSAYLSQREAADARARSEQGATDAAIERERELVQRYRSQRKHVKMHEHERRLEKLQTARTATPRRQAKLSLTSMGRGGSKPVRSGDTVVDLRGVVCGFRGSGEGSATVPITRVERLQVGRGERIGLVGPNGAGKTTLLRTIAGRLPALDGFVRLGQNVVPGYLAQLRAEALPGATVLDAMLAAAPVTEGAARSHLARFLFRGEDVRTPVTELSGGERSRLELAILGIGSANLLLLDEPTNHLDIPAREALQSFLLESEATQIVVSHDRRLLEATCQRLWVVAPGSGMEPATAASFDGSYNAWRQAVADGWTVAAALAGTVGARTAQAPAATVGDGGQRGRTSTNGAGARADVASALPPGTPSKLSKDAYRRERRRIEKDMQGLTTRKSQLEGDLEDPETLSDFIELRRLTTELAAVDEAISLAEDAWLTLEERAP